LSSTRQLRYNVAMTRSHAASRETGSTLADTIRGAAWARVLTQAQLGRVESDVHERSFDAGDCVFRRGEPPRHWLGIVSGLVKISSASSNGKAVTFTGVAAGGWVGESALLRAGPRKADVVAVRASHVALMPRETFDWLLEDSKAFNRYLLLQLNERIGVYFDSIESDRLEDSDVRIAHCIASLFNPVLNPGMRKDLPLSQQEIGLLSGTSRQRTNQALHTLARCGLVRVAYGGVTVSDPDALRRFGG
jgi:CRP-like cAMP-binding protein